MQEFQSLLELLAMLVIDPRTSVLFVLLIVAAVIDFRTYKIPNWLTVSGIAFALIYHTGFAHQTGLLWSLQGLLVGFLLMLPLYALRAMGAGDVKLMAMVGAFLGLPDTLYAVITVFIVGGVVAAGFALLHKAVGRMLSNVRDVVQMMMLSAIGGIKPDAYLAAGTSVGKLPYGVSISIGTIGYVVAKHIGYL